MRTRGLTLVEILLTLAIVSVLASLALAQYRTAEGARSRAGAEQLATLLGRVTEVAWAERTPYRIIFTRGSGLLQLQRWSGSAWTAFDATAVVPQWVLDTGLLPAGVHIASTTYASDTFTAHPLTLASTGQVAMSATAGTVVLQTTHGISLSVTTTANGDVSVSR